MKLFADSHLRCDARYLSVMQVVNEARETVYCADHATARLKQCKTFTADSYHLVYRLDDVSAL